MFNKSFSIDTWNSDDDKELDKVSAIKKTREHFFSIFFAGSNSAYEET
jgi:hypothetical protein